MTPYAADATATQYKFSDDSQIGRVKVSNGNSSSYRFFEIQPIKWIVLNYDKFEIKNDKGEVINMPSLSKTEPMELLANDVLISGIAPYNILWEHNTINKYLNGTFNKESLSFESNARQIASTIYNNTSEADRNLSSTGSNNNYIQGGSSPTTQNLYLLSYFEARDANSPYATNNIFRSNDDRLEAATDYAKAHYQFINGTTGASVWWLRSIHSPSNLNTIGSSGQLSNDPTGSVQMGTRPAMQVGQ